MYEEEEEGGVMRTEQIVALVFCVFLSFWLGALWRHGLIVWKGDGDIDVLLGIAGITIGLPTLILGGFTVYFCIAGGG